VFVVAGNAMLAGADPGEESRAGYVLVTVLGLAQVRMAGPARAGDVILPSGLGDGVGVAVAPAALLLAQVGHKAGTVWSDQTVDGPGWATIVVGFDGVDATVQRLLAEQQQQDARIAELEARLAALEQTARTNP
jgi:hypothetical protein